MVAFAANSLLCREALASGEISAGYFTLIRLVSGAVILFILTFGRSLRQKSAFQLAGSWRSSAALFVYAAGFSYAYLSLGAATGALILFGAVQLTMVLSGLLRGERFSALQWLGMLLALSGLCWFLLPGAEAPSFSGAVLMLLSGIAWGLYSLWGRGAQSPLSATAGNFLRAVPFSIALILFTAQRESFSSQGVLLAIASGALASGLGYALWYAVLPSLRATSAAMVQLSVPVISAFGGLLFLQEPLTLSLSLVSLLVLGGIAVFILDSSRTRS